MPFLSAGNQMGYNCNGLFAPMPIPAPAPSSLPLALTSPLLSPSQSLQSPQQQQPYSLTHYMPMQMPMPMPMPMPYSLHNSNNNNIPYVHSSYYRQPQQPKFYVYDTPRFWREIATATIEKHSHETEYSKKMTEKHTRHPETFKLKSITTTTNEMETKIHNPFSTDSICFRVCVCVCVRVCMSVEFTRYSFIVSIAHQLEKFCIVFCGIFNEHGTFNPIM